MRNLLYKLADGIIVKTQAEAMNSGQSYTVFLENIPREKPELTPKQKARRIKILP